ncbi:MFS transporter [Paenibacillus sp. 481]|uniref:MFS transporter n=1 Tax=Paenibacillus sp. 481 TaxID=2835869 RepID=UPI001E31E6B4|nr:MFS transporter [Paenibacillus sp. 481]UHA72594.1 MFS transporter [Paenibacillus sp. 481]
MSNYTSHHEANWLRAFVFTVFMIASIVVSYFPLYYKSLGFNSVQIGLLYSVGPLVSIVSNLFWGVASDKLRTLKKVIIVLLIGYLIISLALSQITSFAAVSSLLIAFYFFYFPIFPLLDSFAIVTAEAEGKSFISIRVFGSIGFAVSGLVFGFVLGSIGAQYSVWVVIALGTVSLLLAFRLTDKKAKQTTVKKMEFGGLWKVLKQREVVLFFLFVLLLAIAHRLNEAFLGLALIELGANESLVGLAWMLSAVSEIPIFFLLSAYGDRFKELPLLAFSCLMFTIRFLLLAVLQDPIWMLSTQVLHSVSFGIFFFVAIRYLSRVIPDEYRSTGMAVYTIVWSSIAGLLSGTIGGVLMQAYGKDVVYYTSTMFALAASLGFGALAWYSQRAEGLKSLRK